MRPTLCWIFVCNRYVQYSFQSNRHDVKFRDHSFTRSINTGIVVFGYIVPLDHRRFPALATGTVTLFSINEIRVFVQSWKDLGEPSLSFPVFEAQQDILT